jgi:hypothetical protein
MILIFVAALAAGVPAGPGECFGLLSAFISIESTAYSCSSVNLLPASARNGLHEDK